MRSVRITGESLEFSFPDVHADAKMSLYFQRTLRIPDDDREYPLPPGLGAFPLRDVDQYTRRIPSKWAERGGVMLPMYQSEALWLSFHGSYPFCVRVSTGGVCCMTGEHDSPGFRREPQNYLVVPKQPWLDGYNVGGDQIRQFVAAPIDHEASVEKQVTGEAREGGMVIEVRPMTAEAYARHRVDERALLFMACAGPAALAVSEMGFAAGGRMRQEIYDDPYEAAEWFGESISCNVWVCNSLAWRAITQEPPPSPPLEPDDYRRAGFPWFDYFDDQKLVQGSSTLAGLASYMGGNESVDFSPTRIVEIRRSRGMREGEIRIRDNH